MNTIAKGRHGEKIAVSFLLKKGYRIVEQNYRFKKAEIDIIALQNDTLVFVEVKTRGKTNFGFPEDFVSLAQEERILSASEHFMEQAPPHYRFIRFDIIAIIGNKHHFSINHIEDAFH